MSSSKYQGAKPEQKPISQPKTQIGSFFSGVSSFLNSSIKEWTGAPSSTQLLPDDHDNLISSKFDYITINKQRKLCLLLTYSNGFQIWDISDPANAKEIVSKREGPIRFIRLIQNPIGEKSTDPLFSKRPLIAIASAEDSQDFPKSTIKFYSLSTQDYVTSFKFRTEVLDVACNSQFICAVFKDNIAGIDSIKLEKRFKIESLPTPSTISSAPSTPSSSPPSSSPGVFALGPRWLAYPAKTAPPTSGQSTSQGTLIVSQNNAGLMDYTKDVAKDMASSAFSSLKYLGDMGVKKMTTMMTLQEGETQDEAAGSVMVYDTIKKTTSFHFRAHYQHINGLCFDPSGTLLVTSSLNGRNFHVYQMNPSFPNRPVQLYKLFRGYTIATVQDISFNTESTWMAVTTTHGTTHVYAILPGGGKVSTLTHIPKLTNSSNKVYHFESSNENSEERAITLSPCSRIKQNTSQTTSGAQNDEHKSVGSSVFVRYPQGLYHIFVLTQQGNLIESELHPEHPEQGSFDMHELKLSIEAKSEWDMCRKVSWPENRSKGLFENTNIEYDGPFAEATESFEKRWASNIELSTCSSVFRQLWSGPQFNFRRYIFESKRSNDNHPNSILIPTRSSSNLELADEKEVDEGRLISTSPTVGYLDDYQAIMTEKIEPKRQQQEQHNNIEEVDLDEDLCATEHIEFNLGNAISTPMREFDDLLMQSDIKPPRKTSSSSSSSSNQQSSSSSGFRFEVKSDSPPPQQHLQQSSDNIGSPVASSIDNIADDPEEGNNAIQMDSLASALSNSIMADYEPGMKSNNRDSNSNNNSSDSGNSKDEDDGQEDKASTSVNAPSSVSSSKKRNKKKKKAATITVSSPPDALYD